MRRTQVAAKPSSAQRRAARRLFEAPGEGGGPQRGVHDLHINNAGIVAAACCSARGTSRFSFAAGRDGDAGAEARTARCIARLLLGCLLVSSSASAQAVELAASPPSGGAPAVEQVVDVIVVAPRRKEERLADSPRAVTVVDRQQIETSGARDAAEALATQPGLQLDRSFAGAGLLLQGLDPQHSLILVDGERLVGARDGVLDLTRIYAADIEQIEIVRSPASASTGCPARACACRSTCATRAGRRVRSTAARRAPSTTAPTAVTTWRSRWHRGCGWVPIRCSSPRATRCSAHSCCAISAATTTAAPRRRRRRRRGRARAAGHAARPGRPAIVALTTGLELLG